MNRFIFDRVAFIIFIVYKVDSSVCFVWAGFNFTKTLFGAVKKLKKFHVGIISSKPNPNIIYYLVLKTGNFKFIYSLNFVV